MKELNYRQVHLDFHTSEKMPDVGSRFSEENFREALKVGHVNHITVFSKCHHGWKYHPSDVVPVHPTLSFNLLEKQLKICKEEGVSSPIYISAGFDENYAVQHMDHLVKPTPGSGTDFLNPAFHHICFNTPYLDRLAAEVEEVMQKYSPEGVFLDISDIRICYCPYCLKAMEEAGLDPQNPEDVKKQAEITYKKYTTRMEEAVRKYSKDTAIFHNAGHIRRGRRDIAFSNTHLELESLPTASWGYDHFPLSAAYARTLGMDYLGMTGKFHRGWGEFGGFKHPNALRYETALSIAQGAKCSIGDQLHPLGEMNMATYRLIGAAYSEVEEKEPWLKDSCAVSDVAILSTEAFAPDLPDDGDVGASRVLLEGKYLFDLIDRETDLAGYKLLILPDVIRLDEDMKKRLEDYISGGGKILASGYSCLWEGRDSFAINVGAEYGELNTLNPTYYRPEFETLGGSAEYLVYAPSHLVRLAGGSSCAKLQQPYFNRAYNHFCSHLHTPNQPGADYDGVILTENTAYVAWNIFEEYSKNGTYYVKELLLYLIDKLIGDKKSISAALPDRGVVTLRKQEKDNRFVAHLLYAHTSLRGDGVEVIEDVVPLYGVSLSLKTRNAPKRVYLAPTGEEIPFEYKDGSTFVTVPKVYIHQMVIFDM